MCQRGTAPLSVVVLFPRCSVRCKAYIRVATHYIMPGRCGFAKHPSCLEPRFLICWCDSCCLLPRTADHNLAITRPAVPDKLLQAGERQGYRAAQGLWFCGIFRRRDCRGCCAQPSGEQRARRAPPTANLRAFTWRSVVLVDTALLQVVCRVVLRSDGTRSTSASVAWSVARRATSSAAAPCA